VGRVRGGAGDGPGHGGHVGGRKQRPGVQQVGHDAHGGAHQRALAGHDLQGRAGDGFRPFGGHDAQVHGRNHGGHVGLSAGDDRDVVQPGGGDPALDFGLGCGRGEPGEHEPQAPAPRGAPGQGHGFDEFALALDLVEAAQQADHEIVVPVAEPGAHPGAAFGVEGEACAVHPAEDQVQPVRPDAEHVAEVGVHHRVGGHYGVGAAVVQPAVGRIVARRALVAARAHEAEGRPGRAHGAPQPERFAPVAVHGVGPEFAHHAAQGHGQPGQGRGVAGIERQCGHGQAPGAGRGFGFRARQGQHQCLVPGLAQQAGEVQGVPRWR
jgi:hypothetical protein